MPSIADKKDEESQIEAYKDEQDVKVLNGKPEVKVSLFVLVLFCQHFYEKLPSYLIRVRY